MPTTAAARDDLVLANLDLVAMIARTVERRLPAHVEYDDLYGAGIMGLIDAASKFDPKRNVGFRTYAKFRVRGSILDELRAIDWATRGQRQAIKDADAANAPHRSLRVNRAGTVIEPAGPSAMPHQLVQRAELSRALAAAITALRPRHERVIDLHYRSGLTMREIGTELGVTRWRIGQIHRAALRKMRRHLDSAGIRACDVV